MQNRLWSKPDQFCLGRVKLKPARCTPRLWDCGSMIVCESPTGSRCFTWLDAYVNLSSAKRWYLTWCLSNSSCTSSLYAINCTGPKAEPWGTVQYNITGKDKDWSLPAENVCERSVRYDWNQDATVASTENRFRRMVRRQVKRRAEVLIERAPSAALCQLLG